MLKDLNIEISSQPSFENGEVIEKSVNKTSQEKGIKNKE